MKRILDFFSPAKAHHVFVCDQTANGAVTTRTFDNQSLTSRKMTIMVYELLFKMTGKRFHLAMAEKSAVIDGEKVVATYFVITA